ncbi:MAG: caspase family protein, partial [Arenimonas sp.]
MTRFSVFCTAALVVVATALPVEAPLAKGVRNAEDLLIVDCLLPGQIRSLGRQATFMSARRPIRTTQSDCQIRGGEFVSYDRANYQTALKVWLDQAMAGSAEAQNNVGEIYSKGLGTDPDYGMAAQWFKKASDQGYNRAKINLGFLYEQGLGVPQDTALALNLYREGSGLQDELLYASEVEVQFKEKDAAISGLQTQVQTAQADSAELREQVKQLQSQLAERRRALESSQRELGATQSKLAQARASQDTGLSKLLENQLLAQEQQISTQRTQIASLEQRSGAGSASAGVLAGAPGSLQILDPIFVATRGRSTAVVRAPGKRKLVGRVSNPSAVASVTVNGQPATLAANGTFSSDVDVSATGTQVKVAAIDKRGGRAQLDFTMIPQAGGVAGSTAELAPAGAMPSGLKLGRFYAVVIGNNTYNDGGYQALKSAASDATAVANVLRSRYGYQTTVLLNASRLQMLSALNDMREQLGVNDNLLIYYAGHGEIDAAGKGYWIPSDAVAGNSKTWISNAVISDMLNAMPAKHVLTVVDSCYSGTMTGTSAPSFDPGSMPADKWATWVKTMANGRSRTAMTSGGLQPVPDVGAGNHSYFARAFVNALQDNNKFVEAGRLYRSVATSVALTSVNAPLPQNPQYAAIRFAGH